MNRKLVSIIVGVIVIGIIGIIVGDFLSKRPDRMGDNPYEYDVDKYRLVDSDLISYRETKIFPMNGFKPGGIAVSGDAVWVCGEGRLQGFKLSGELLVDREIEGLGTAIVQKGEKLYVSFEDHVEVYGVSGEKIDAWEGAGLNSVLTSVAVKDSTLYVADAGNRRVLLYDLDGVLRGEFTGKAESNAGHGFIVPSANFDLVVNEFGELWVVNPGKHALENYSDSGELRGYWESVSMAIEGFSGCCNPAEVAVMKDGSFVTSEKGMVRIKIYDMGGKLMSVVAPPSKFEEEGHAPEVAVDDEGRIIALDFDREVVRVFERKQDDRIEAGDRAKR